MLHKIMHTIKKGLIQSSSSPSIWGFFSLCVAYIRSNGWLVCCSLTSHSAIFHLYSDGTFVQFPNLDLLPGTQTPWASRSLYGAEPTPTPSEHAVRVCRELNSDRPIHSPARYLYATAAGRSNRAHVPQIHFVIPVIMPKSGTLWHQLYVHI